MIMSGRDKWAYDSYKRTDIVEFWGLVWEHEEYIKKIKREQKKKKGETDE